MTDTPTTYNALLTQANVDRLIGRITAECDRLMDNGTDVVWLEFWARDIAESHRQQHWDAISRDQTIENLRNENERYREALEFYAAHGGERARAALGEAVTP